MMRLGILASAGGWHVEDLERAARGAQIETLCLHFTQLGARVAPPRFEAGLCDTSVLTALLVRSMPGGSLEQVIFRMDWLQRVEASGLLVVNRASALEACIDKYLSSARLEAAGLELPTTVACENAATAARAFDALGGDVVVKPIFGSEGHGLERISSVAAARSHFAALEEEGRIFYLQRFVAHPGYDYRVFVLGDRARWCMKRYAVNDWRTNLACGGRAEAVSPPAELSTLAVQAAQCLGAEIAGVDLIVDTEGHPWLLEVNAVPGWRALARVCDVDIAAEVLRYVGDRVSTGIGSRE
jgi:RimK family alpha-L-glutamate ligase